MFPEQHWLIIGKLVAAQGLNGQIRVNPSSDFPERFTRPGIRWLQKSLEEPQKIKLLHGRQIPGKAIYVITLQGINDRSSAESLIGLNLLVAANDRPKLKKNEFHFLDLIELEVKLNPNEPAIGKVKNLINAGNDLLEIELFEGKTVLIPFVKEIVPEVDIDKGWLRLSPPPGLLDLEAVD
tara:strand:+ start:1245 stop:1787 length:543 start_codon:yes stop_codon:yes gene_type:complete